VGKWAIHPSQIDIALDVYSPKAEDVARARKLEKAYAEAEAAGLGAINVDGVMVDVASIRILRNTVLNKAGLYGMGSSARYCRCRCHPERSEGPLGLHERSLAALGMTDLSRHSAIFGRRGVVDAPRGRAGGHHAGHPGHDLAQRAVAQR